MPQNISISIKVRFDSLREELQRLIQDAGGFQVVRPGDNLRPDLLIYELGNRPDDDFKKIQALLEANAISEVFVTADAKDADLLLKAMRAGAKEFIHKPLDEAEVVAALQACRRRMEQTPAVKEPEVHAGRIINVIGAKGGVGTTTVAVNLAMTLAEKKKAGTVALVDLNTIFGEIPLFLSITPTYHWGQIVKNVGRLDPTFLLNAMSRHPNGVYLLPSPSSLNGGPPATADIMARLLATMRQTFDFIIVDGGQSLDGPALKAIETAERILLVTLLNLPCLHNTTNLLQSLAKAGVAQADRIHLIVNRYLKKSDITLQEAQETVRSPFYWTISNDYKTTMSAINRGKPLYEIAPKAEITREIDGLAEAILHGDREPRKKKGWFSKK